MAVVDALTGVVEAQFDRRQHCSNSPGDCEDGSMTTTTHRFSFEPDASGHPSLMVYKQSVTRPDAEGNEVTEQFTEVEQCCLWSKEGDRFQCTPDAACSAPVAPSGPDIETSPP